MLKHVHCLIKRAIARALSLLSPLSLYLALLLYLARSLALHQAEFWYLSDSKLTHPGERTDEE